MKKINFFKLSLTVFLVTFLMSVITYAKTTQENIAESVLRLHIIANSNRDEDQSLKLLVRDRILKDGKELFKNISSRKDAEKIIKENINYLKNIAENEIRKQGYSYKVQIQTGEFPFPVKIYDDIMLPSGKYMAVRIIIGEGKGENWWCVMYPPMCALDDITVKNGKEVLKQSLSGEDYRLISPENPPAKIRFKIVDFINSIM